MKKLVGSREYRDEKVIGEIRGEPGIEGSGRREVVNGRIFRYRKMAMVVGGDGGRGGSGGGEEVLVGEVQEVVNAETVRCGNSVNVHSFSVF